MKRIRPFMRPCLTILTLLICITQPVWAGVDTGLLEDSLPPDAQDTLDNISPENIDLNQGIKGLWERAKTKDGEYIRQALSVGFLMLCACLIIALAVGFSGDAGLRLPEKLSDFTAVAVLLTIYFSAGSSLINECIKTIAQLDGFIKVLTPVYVAASALAGRPVSAVATGEITLFCSALVLWVCRYMILPGISLYVLMDSVGTLLPTSILGKLAELFRWGVGKTMKWSLAGFTAYQTLSGMVTRSSDALAVKAAQSAFSSLIPVVGNMISSTSETLLGGAALLRTSVGIYGVLAVCAICLGPILRAALHFFVFKVLSACGSSFLGSASARTLRCITDGYGMAVGTLGICCTVEFIAIVVSAVVTAS